MKVANSKEIRFFEYLKIRVFDQLSRRAKLIEVIFVVIG